MTHAPPKETCWLHDDDGDGYCDEYCIVTPHEPHWSQQEWDDEHARSVSLAQSQFWPPNC